jgi:transposase, IS5 family
MQELQRWLDSMGLFVKKGSIRAATFIIAGPGALGDRPAGENARTRRSKDGTWMKKRNEI